MPASLKPFWLSLAGLWLAGIAVLRLYPWPDTPGPGVAAAFLVEGSLFLALGFPAVMERLKGTWPAVLAASGLLPYCLYSLSAGVFDWRSLAALAALAAVAAFWFRAIPRHPASDLAFLALMAGISLTRLFPDLYAPVSPKLRVDFLGQMMWRRVAIAAVLLYRPMAGIDLGFLPARREWLVGLREFLYFIPLGAVLLSFTGFARFQPLQAEPLKALLIAVGIFLGMLWFVALTEEFFFRGLLQQWLSEWLRSPRAGLLLASVAFGAVHLTFRYPPLNWRFALLAAAGGIFYGRAFRCGGIRAAMVAHALVNVTWRVLFV
ncbi:MAG: CPBP family intramembrane metalloprotease [Acidobacteria bacterium]|nr:CPBP family intramembrane metalloprotease [Acidobacteriota bacterium]